MMALPQTQVITYHSQFIHIHIYSTTSKKPWQEWTTHRQCPSKDLKVALLSHDRDVVIEGFPFIAINNFSSCLQIYKPIYAFIRVASLSCLICPFLYPQKIEALEFQEQSLKFHSYQFPISLGMAHAVLCSNHQAAWSCMEHS